MPPLFLRPALAGAAATCAGNGLVRFAYIPLFLAMATASWVDGGALLLDGALRRAVVRLPLGLPPTM